MLEDGQAHNFISVIFLLAPHPVLPHSLPLATIWQQIKLKEREEDIRFLRMELAEGQRNVAVESNRVPERKALQRELVAAQLELAAAQEQAQKLEEQVQTPELNNRWRVLPGTDPSKAELVEKMETLTSRLVSQEEKLLERDLVFQETETLVSRAQRQAENGRGDTLELAKAVNDYKSRVQDLTRKLMATVAELSVYQVGASGMAKEGRNGKARRWAVEEGALH